jgi:hypothetical protein
MAKHYSIRTSLEHSSDEDLNMILLYRLAYIYAQMFVVPQTRLNGRGGFEPEPFFGGCFNIRA